MLKFNNENNFKKRFKIVFQLDRYFFQGSSWYDAISRFKETKD